ncbi:MAG: site-specific integrase [Chloroflexota bacterium]
MTYENLSKDNSEASLTVQQAVKEYLSRYSGSSQRAMTNSLDVAARLLSHQTATASTYDWSKLSSEELEHLPRLVDEQYAAATANRVRSALRGFLRLAISSGVIQPSMELSLASLKNQPRKTIREHTVLTESDYQRLLESCQDERGVKRSRDSAIIALLYATGATRQEVVDLEMGDLEADLSRLRLPGHGKVTARTIALGSETVGYLYRWLQERGREPGPLVCALDRFGELRMPHRSIATQALYLLVQHHGRHSGLTSITPHDFRHSFLLRTAEGADPDQIQRDAGFTWESSARKYIKETRAESAPAEKRKASSSDDWRSW